LVQGRTIEIDERVPELEGTSQEHWQARSDDAVDVLAVPQQADHIVNGDTRALDARVAASYVWRPHNVSVGPRNLAAHDPMLRDSRERKQIRADRHEPQRLGRH
jgi:hypothetical protein